MVADGLPMGLRGIAAAFIGRVTFNNCAVQPVNQILNQIWL